MPRKLSDDEEARRRAAHIECPSDAAAARRLEMKHGRYAEWRRSRGLPSKRAVKQGARHRQRLATIGRARSFAEAAKDLGEKPRTIEAWYRYHYGPAPFRAARAEVDAERRAAYDGTNSDAAAGAHSDTERRTFGSWRSKHNLKAKGGAWSPQEPAPRRPSHVKLTNEELGRRLRVWHSMKHAKMPDAARALGLRPPAYRSWMDVYGLPDHHRKPARDDAE